MRTAEEVVNDLVQSLDDDLFYEGYNLVRGEISMVGYGSAALEEVK